MLTYHQKTKALKAHLREIAEDAGFIPSQQWLKDKLYNYYKFIDDEVYHVHCLPQVEPKSQSHDHGLSESNEISHTNKETSKELITTPLYTNNETSNANHDSNSEHLECDSEQNDHSSEQIDKYNQQSWIKILKANYQRLYIIKEALIGDKYVIWHCGKSQVDNNFIWGMTSIHTYCYPSLTSENFVGTFYDCSEVFEKHNHLNKINEAVILHHEGIKAFLNKYNDVQVLRAFYFEATDRFLIFCKDLKVKKTKKEEYCLFWWDWENRITTKSGDYIDCFLQYERLVDVMGNPKPISLPKSPDLTEYYRNVSYCPADGKRCEQFTLSLGV